MSPSRTPAFLQRHLATLGLLALSLLSACGGGGGGAASLPAAVAPVITTQPVSQSVTVGQPAAFTVVATGTTPLHYAWKLGSAAVGSDAAGYALVATQSADGGSYSVTVSNAAGSVTSAAFTLTVAPLPKVIVYQRAVPLPGGGTQQDLYAVNEDGTGSVALASSQDDEYLAMDRSSGTAVPAILGDRIIYRRVVGGSQVDIYSVKSDGTGTVALAATAADEAVYAVLGDRVLIGSTSGLLTVKADGSSPVAFPAGASFVGALFGRVFYNSALASGSLRFYSALPDGTGTVELLNTPGALVRKTSPNGARTTLTTGADLFFYEANGTNATPCYVSAADGSGKALLATNAAFLGATSWGIFEGGASAWPVADRLVYQTATGLFSVKLDGTGTQAMASLAAGAFLTGGLGTRAIYEALNTDGSTSLYGADITGSSPTLLASRAGSGMTSGTRAIIIRNASGYNFDASTINADGTAEATLITQAYATLSTISSQESVFSRALGLLGDRILFRKQVGTPATPFTPDLFAIHNDGTGLVALASGGEKDPEALGPDRLYFRRVVNGQSDLYSILPDGTGLVTLANGATEERFGLLVGTKVVFTRKAVDGHRDLYIVNGDGSAEKLLSNSADDKTPLAVF